MKRLTTLVAGLLIAATAGAQSYMVRSNGVVYNVDQDGNLHNNSQFILPYMISVKGGMFYISDKRVITTIDENGFFYRLDPRQFEAPKSIRFSGYNYFCETDGTVWSFDRQGLLYKAKANWDFRKPMLSGGKYFVLPGKRRELARLIVINDSGQVLEVKVPDLDPAKISNGGNNWFTDSTGSVFTLSPEGFVYNKTEFVGKVNEITAKGGVFFVANNKLYTIAEDGSISSRGLISKFGNIAKTGHNYFLTQNNKLFTIDQKGAVISNTSNQDISNITLTTF
jgi:hypothetical protein